MWKVVERRLPLAQGLDALADLEPLVSAARRVFVYGEPFRQPDLGVHNIHQNHGDPLGSRWSAENGVWQDCATVVQREDGSYGAFCNKFRTQSDRTDDDGRPVEGSHTGRIDVSTSSGLRPMTLSDPGCPMRQTPRRARETTHGHPPQPLPELP